MKNLIATEYPERQGNCWYCGTPIFDMRDLRSTEEEGDWEVPEGFVRRITEHQTPISRGGNNIASNRVDACAYCNSVKGTKTLEEFRHRCCFGDDWPYVRDIKRGINYLLAKNSKLSTLSMLLTSVLSELDKHYVRENFVFYGEGRRRVQNYRPTFDQGDQELCDAPDFSNLPQKLPQELPQAA